MIWVLQGFRTIRFKSAGVSRYLTLECLGSGGFGVIGFLGLAWGLGLIKWRPRCYIVPCAPKAKRKLWALKVPNSSFRVEGFRGFRDPKPLNPKPTPVSPSLDPNETSQSGAPNPQLQKPYEP